MLRQPTIESLNRLRLYGMATALQEQLQGQSYQDLSFEERLGLLIDREVQEQENRRLEFRLRMARLRQSAVIEDVDFRASRGLHRAAFLELATCQWIKNHQNILLTGPTGVGKSYLACALAQKACREGYSVQYHRASKLLHELATARGDGRYLRLLKALSRLDLIILDDWGLETLSKDQRHDLLEIFDADSILDRVIHNAHILNLKGESMRKKLSPTSKNKSGT